MQNLNPTEPISFRMDKKNKDKLEELADKKGLKIGTYMRFEALKIIENSESINV